MVGACGRVSDHGTVGTKERAGRTAGISFTQLQVCTPGGCACQDRGGGTGGGDTRASKDRVEEGLQLDTVPMFGSAGESPGEARGVGTGRARHSELESISGWARGRGSWFWDEQVRVFSDPFTRPVTALPA